MVSARAAVKKTSATKVEVPIQVSITKTSDLGDCKRFLSACMVELGLGFHPDTLFEDYITLPTDVRTYDDTIAGILNQRLSIVMDKFQEADEDPYGYCLYIIHGSSDAGSQLLALDSDQC